jgi:hypothetical protein
MVRRVPEVGLDVGQQDREDLAVDEVEDVHDQQDREHVVRVPRREILLALRG